MKKFRIKGNTEIIAASCMKQALCKLVDPDGVSYTEIIGIPKVIKSHGQNLKHPMGTRGLLKNFRGGINRQ